jgi:hypothetical protein
MAWKKSALKHSQTFSCAFSEFMEPSRSGGLRPLSPPGTGLASFPVPGSSPASPFRAAFLEQPGTVAARENLSPRGCACPRYCHARGHDFIVLRRVHGEAALPCPGGLRAPGQTLLGSAELAIRIIFRAVQGFCPNFSVPWRIMGMSQGMGALSFRRRDPLSAPGPPPASVGSPVLALLGVPPPGPFPRQAARMQPCAKTRP